MRLFAWPTSAQQLPTGEVTDEPGPIRSVVAGSGDLFGWWSGARLLDDHGADEVARAGHRGAGIKRVVASSGAFGLPGSGEDGGAIAMLRTHAGEGMTALLAAIGRAEEGLKGTGPEAVGAEICLRPEAAHVLSDLPSCLVFLRSAAAARVRLLLDPMAMLTPAMVAHAEDHLERILGTLGPHPAVAGLMLANAAAGEDGGPLRSIGVHREREAVFDSRRLIAMFAAHARPDLDWVVPGGGVEAQVDLLRRYGPGF